jgi:hypothetical protein
MAILIAGGNLDPNLAVLLEAAARHGIPVIDARHGTEATPAFTWCLGSGTLQIDGARVSPSAAFVRFDVFGEASGPAAHRSQGWYSAIYGLLQADSQIHLFNRNISPVAASKPAVLLRAREVGLRIPDTLITNERAVLAGPPTDRVAKPTGGGDYCYDLSQLLPNIEFRQGLASVPAIVQRRLVGPEVRIYLIGRRSFAFEMRSHSLDYRVKQDVDVISLSDVPPELKALTTLMAGLGMDFGAADFKTDPASGRLVFLELNTSPMFARFSQATDGALAGAMVEELLTRQVFQG